MNERRVSRHGHLKPGRQYLQPGDRWRREINRALDHRAAKVLLVSRNATLDDQAVQDDIDIAIDVAERRGDRRFIIPLRLESVGR